HRSYRVLLLLFDYGAAMLGSYTAIATYPKAPSGFQRVPELFELTAYLFLPLVWLIAVWGHGGYDRRYLGMGTDEFKRVFRAFVFVTALVGFVVFATVFVPSRATIGLALGGALLYL